MKVLLIDDDQDFNDAIYQHLIRKGFDVHTAFDGIQGLRKFQLVKPDIVITDIIMPDQDGLGFLTAIRDSDNNLPCKVIAISGGGRVAGKTYLEIAKSFGVNATLSKPFSFKELYDVLIQLDHVSDSEKKV